MRLTELYLAPSLTRNIMPYGMLEKKDFPLTYKMERRALVCRTTDDVVFDVEMKGNVLAVRSFSDHANPFSMLLTSI